MEYFDSRGVRRTYEISLENGVLRIWRDHPGFDQRLKRPSPPTATRPPSSSPRSPASGRTTCTWGYPPRLLGVQVGPLPCGAEDRDELHGAVDGAEPVRGPGRELDGLARPRCRRSPSPSSSRRRPLEDVEPVVALVHREQVGRPVALRVDVDLEGVQPAGGAAVRQRPHMVKPLCRRGCGVRSAAASWRQARRAPGGSSERLSVVDARRSARCSVAPLGASSESDGREPPLPPLLTAGSMDDLGLHHRRERGRRPQRALVLGRARRRTLLVDADGPSNRVAHGVGGLLGHDGRPPAEFYAAGRAELAAYDAVGTAQRDVVSGERDGDGFTLDLAAARRETRPLGAAGDRHGLPLPDAAGDRRALGRVRIPLPVLPRLGGPRRAARRARPRRRRPRARAAAARVERRRDAADRRRRRARRRRTRPAATPPASRSTNGAVTELPRPGTPTSRRSPSTTAASATSEACSCRSRCISARTSPGSSALARPADAAHPRRSRSTRCSRPRCPGLFAAGDTTGDMPSVPNAVASGAKAAAAIVRSLTANVAALR